MPTDKKRINLTIPDPIYQKLLSYKERNGVVSDATACLQLITQQLNGLEKTEMMMDLLRKTSTEQLLQLSAEGLTYMKEEIEKVAPPTEKPNGGPPPGGG